MITGSHLILYSQNAEADRTFFREVLGFRSVDAGGGWPIFALPPAELAIHPASAPLRQPEAGDDPVGAGFYLMCDDVQAMVQQLAERGVSCSPLASARWGIRTTIPLPGGGKIGLYQPTHPTAIALTR